MNIQDKNVLIKAGKPKHFPCWFSKACRSYLKRKGLDSRKSTGCVVRRALNAWRPGLSSVIDHYGSFKKGEKWYVYSQPYNHQIGGGLISSLSAFLSSNGAVMYESGKSPGPHHPETVYLEFGESHYSR